MTCYSRNIQQIFKKAGIEVEGENKREIDRVIHNILAVEYKKTSIRSPLTCSISKPLTTLKGMDSPEKRFITTLK